MFKRKLIKEVKTTKVTPSEMKNFIGDNAMNSVKLVPYEAVSVKTKSKPRAASFTASAKKTPAVASSGKGKMKSKGRLGKMKSRRGR